jgi:hypothetical protein
LRGPSFAFASALAMAAGVGSGPAAGVLSLVEADAGVSLPPPQNATIPKPMAATAIAPKMKGLGPDLGAAPELRGGVDDGPVACFEDDFRPIV